MQKISFIGRLERNQGATMFFITGKKKKQLLVFDKKLLILYKMETQKNINLLYDSSNEKSKLATKTGMS